jgi:ABC-2 type transport system ATP-binding protein
LLEHHGLYERLTAVDNLEFYGRVWRIPSSERRARIKELLSQLDLWERREEITGQWSRGMKQKLAIARTLLHRPRLVFMDEPTAGLDPVAAAALRNDLALLTQREGVMIFLTTHNLDEAEKLCHHLAVIRQGRLLAFGSPDELRQQESGHQVEILGQGFISESLLALKNQPSVSKVQLDDHRLIIELTRDTETAPLVSLLVSAGAQVEEVHKSKVSLEEVFLALMAEETAESITR